MVKEKKTCLLVGRMPFDEESTREAIGREDLNLMFGKEMVELEQAFARSPIDVVIVGDGVNHQDRQKIIEYVCAKSKSTSLHMKDWESEREGMMPFFNRVLNNLN